MTIVKKEYFERVQMKGDEDEGLEIDLYCKIQRSQVWGYKLPKMLDLYT